MKHEIDFRISNIFLGTHEGDTPEDDVHRYLVVDDFSVKPFSYTGGEHSSIRIDVTQFHIDEYPIVYCVGCLKHNVKNSKVNYGVPNVGAWCRDHYAEKMRREHPEQKCPQCDKGYIKTDSVMEYQSCTHCDYYKSQRPLLSMIGASSQIILK